MAGHASWAAATAASAWLAAAASACADPVEDLSKLSIEELGGVQVTSVSKRPETIGEAPSSVYVISHDDIVRSGALNVPEVLRLAPNLRVAQVSASRYIITARGMGGAEAAQNFSNKLLVLIDGRSVYSPLYSGVYWDMQDVLLQDVERIEVISGPGATLWGANAVNGVINIITRSAAETQGAFVSAAAGGHQGRAELRYGGKLGENLAYRVYADTYVEEQARQASGAPAHDRWSRPQGGFRLDWTPSDLDAATLQGDIYSGTESQLAAAPEDVKGWNLTGRWTRSRPDGASFQVQAYYDHAERSAEVSGAGFWVDTYDVDVQGTLAVNSRHQIVYGGDYRALRYKILGTPTLFWVPDARTLQLGSVFVQDSITLSPALKAVLGAKVEADPYLRPVVLPNARLSWTPGEGVTVWTAVSRAIRSATPFDTEVKEKVAPGAAVFLSGDRDFRSEKLIAYELGTKLYLSPRASFSATAFYHRYTDLRSIEPHPGGFLPLQWGNGMRGHVMGVEAWGQYQATPWWRLSASVVRLEEKFSFKPGASGLLGPTQAANDPKYQAQLKSSMTFDTVVADAWFRHASAALAPRAPAYSELDARLGWKLAPRLMLSINGRNLLHARHSEYVAGEEIPRSVFAELQWRY